MYLMSALGVWLFFSFPAQGMPQPRALEGEPIVRVRTQQKVSTLKVRGLDLRVSGRLQTGTSVFAWDCKKHPPHRTVEVESMSGFVSMQGEIIRGKIRLTPGCDVVQVLSLEKYVEGLVNAEFSSKWSETAVEAQIIAARTYAYKKWLKTRGLSGEFDVEATIKDQVYGGFKLEDAQASRLVSNTRGRILMERSGSGWQPISAYYHSTCGGRTELASEVWGGGGSHTVVCEGCRKSPRFHWETRVELSELKAHLPNSGGAIRKLGFEDEIIVASRTRSGRIKRLRWGHWEFKASELRLWLGPLRIQSTWFEPHIRRDFHGKAWLEIRGLGYGHGVGMCQYGAKDLGERGMSTQGILAHYYPGTNIQKLW